jgi:hypothetical protein
MLAALDTRMQWNSTSCRSQRDHIPGVAHPEAMAAYMQRGLGFNMARPERFELPTFWFPPRRTLSNCVFSFCQGAIQFFSPLSSLKISFPPHRVRTRSKMLLVNEHPRAPVFGRTGKPSVVLAEALIHVGTGADILPFGHGASKHVNEAHAGKEWRALRDSNSRPSGS